MHMVAHDLGCDLPCESLFYWIPGYEHVQTYLSAFDRSLHPKRKLILSLSIY